MVNRILKFDERKVTIVKADDMETAWYDITDFVRALSGDKKSVLEYVSKIEMDIFRFYPFQSYESDKMSQIRQEFENRIAMEEHERFKCVNENGSVAAYNDGGSIRLTFKNGAVLISKNSEWGGIKMLQGPDNAGAFDDTHNELFMEEP